MNANRIVGSLKDRWGRFRAALLATALLAAALGVADPAGPAAAHEVDPADVPQFDPPPPGTYELPPIMDAPDGTVVGVDGSRHRLHEYLRGHVTLLSFMYTRCRDPRGCPLAFDTLLDLKEAMATEPGAGRDVRFVSLSFDPEHDTPSAMRRYGSHVIGGPGPRWTFLTTPSSRALRPLLDGFGQDVDPGRDPSTDRLDGTLSHVLKVFLIDERLRVREIYSTSFLVMGVLRNDIETLRMERRPSRDTPRAPGRAGRSEPPSATHAAARVALGRKLFFDRRLSSNHTMSCGMCHVPEQGFTSNEMATAVGIHGRSLRRNAPTSLNVGDVAALFVDGRASSLESQVWGPLLAPDEMGNASRDDVIERIRRLSDYRVPFLRAYGRDGITESTVAGALASFERSLVAVGSPFDTWRAGARTQDFGEAQRAGFSVFLRAGCGQCHTVGDHDAAFTDGRFHNTGVAWRSRTRRQAGTVSVALAPGVRTSITSDVAAAVGEPERDDLGRYEVTGREGDRDAFRTPSLRNVSLTAPYMHDGSLPTLRAVIDYYDRGPDPAARAETGLAPLHLSDDEKAQLVAFLESLASPRVAALVKAARARPPD